MFMLAGRFNYNLRTLFAVIALVAVVVGLVTWCLSNPLRRSDADIRLSVLQKTPLGIELSHVETISANENWNARPYRGDSGRGPGNALRGHLGSYQGLPWHVRVDAVWEFDASNKLKDIRIVRTSDSL